MNPIVALEHINGMIAHDKASVLLVHGNLKPSALVVLEGESFESMKEPVLVSPSSVATLKEIFTSFGIEYVYTSEIMDSLREGSYVEVLRFFIAKDIATAQKLKELFDDVATSDSTVHRQIGNLLGYPTTAVDAFLTTTMLDLEAHPVSTHKVNTRDMRLLGHRLSKENWQEEVSYLNDWGSYLRSQSPSIYEQATQED